MIERAWDSEQAEHTIYEPCPECFALVPFNQILYQSKDVRAYGGPFGGTFLHFLTEHIISICFWCKECGIYWNEEFRRVEE